MTKKFILNTSYILILFIGLVFSLFLKKAIAIKPMEEVKSTNSADTSQEPKVKKPKFPDRGIPTGRRRGGTSRSECNVSHQVLTAIVPGKEAKKVNNSGSGSSPEFAPQIIFNKSESFLTRTLEEYPTFWIYVPKLTNWSQKGEFILQNEQDQDIYRSLFNLPNKSGILKIKLPSQPRNSLRVGQKYHWYVKVFCGDEQARSRYIFVDAWIQRVAVSPKLKQQLDTENVNRYEILIDNNIWHDAIDSLAKLQQTNLDSKTEKAHWNKLLRELNLLDLIDQSVLDVKANPLTE
ncbi:MAG: hypothetical protein RLZZ535_707 [Cyanobacteriota bacterium]